MTRRATKRTTNAMKPATRYAMRSSVLSMSFSFEVGLFTTPIVAYFAEA